MFSRSALPQPLEQRPPPAVPPGPRALPAPAETVLPRKMDDCRVQWLARRQRHLRQRCEGARLRARLETMGLAHSYSGTLLGFRRIDRRLRGAMARASE